VRIKPRTKGEQVTDEFLVVVNYQVELTSDEKDSLRKKVPNTPTKNRLFSKNQANGYYKLTESESSIIEEPDLEDDPKNHPNDSDIESPSLRPLPLNLNKLASYTSEEAKTTNFVKNSANILYLQDLVKL